MSILLNFDSKNGDLHCEICGKFVEIWFQNVDKSKINGKNCRILFLKSWPGWLESFRLKGIFEACNQMLVTP